MSNDKHPDHHFDEDLIAKLYDDSKEEMQPSIDMDDLILSQLNDSSGGSVVKIPVARDDVKNTHRKSPKKRWFVPNSLVACLVVSVMVGLIYKENADQLLISDPTELDYGIPTPAVERSITTKSSVSVLDEDGGVESDEVSVDFEDKEVQERQLLMDSASSFSELRSELRSELGSELRSKVQGVSAANVEALVVKKQEVAEQEFSTLRVESKKMAAQKAKKSKPKTLKRQMAPSPMLMMAPPIQAEKSAEDTLDLDVEFNKIRKLRDAGDVVGAKAMLNVLIAKYPSMELPDDIVLLKEGL